LKPHTVLKTAGVASTTIQDGLDKFSFGRSRFAIVRQRPLSCVALAVGDPCDVVVCRMRGAGLTTTTARVRTSPQMPDAEPGVSRGRGVNAIRSLKCQPLEKADPFSGSLHEYFLAGINSSHLVSHVSKDSHKNWTS
jgi:hypothetical protein